MRVLLATDAASEGISLQRHCHLLAHAEIPWNPNRLEQRNGRIDRHGQPAAEVLVHHCVSAGWETAPRGSLEGDLDFLARAVTKVEQIREDLGSAGPVIAAQIEEAMLGRRATLDDTRFSGAAASRVLQQERRMRERLAALRDELAESRTRLHLKPDRVERVVSDGARARPPAAAAPGAEPGTYVVPALTASWSRAMIGLEHPARPDERRPITFDHESRGTAPTSCSPTSATRSCGWRWRCCAPRCGERATTCTGSRFVTREPSLGRRSRSRMGGW